MAGPTVAGMKIVVTTPTGRVGSLLAPLLVRAGVRPTLLARDASRIDPAVRAAHVVHLVAP